MVTNEPYSKNNRSENSRESFDINLSRYFLLFKRRWLIVAAIMLGSVGLAAVAAFLQPSTYEASAKLLVKVDRTSSLTGFGEGVGELSPLVTAQNPLSTELEVMTSRPILTEVIQRLKLKDGDGETVSAQELQEELETQILGGADVIQISLTNPSPVAAARVVNTLAEIYIENNIADNRAQSTKALQLLERRLPDLEAFVSQSEAQLRNFKQNNSIISLPEEAKSTVEVLEDVQAQAFTTAVELQQATVQVRQLQNNLGLTVQQAMLVSEISENPAVQGALDDLQTLERQKSIELGFYTAQSPAVQVYQAQINSLQGLLRQEMTIALDGHGTVRPKFWQAGDTQRAFITSFVEAETARLSLAQRLSALENVLETYQRRGEAIPRLEQSQAELERKLEVARTSYQSSLERLQALQSAETQVVENARLIEPAIAPENPTSSKKIILLAGIVAGAFLSTAAVALLEILAAQRRVKARAAFDEANLYPQTQPAPAEPEAAITNGLAVAESDLLDAVNKND